MLAPTSLQYGYRKTKDTMKHAMRWTQSEKPLHQSNPYPNMCWSRGAKYLSGYYLFECDSFGVELTSALGLTMNWWRR